MIFSANLCQWHDKIIFFSFSREARPLSQTGIQNIAHSFEKIQLQIGLIYLIFSRLQLYLQLCIKGTSVSASLEANTPWITPARNLRKNIHFLKLHSKSAILSICFFKAHFIDVLQIVYKNTVLVIVSSVYILWTAFLPLRTVATVHWIQESQRWCARYRTEFFSSVCWVQQATSWVTSITCLGVVTWTM